MERAAALLAATLLPGKQRIGIDRRALPPALARSHRVDRHVEVRTGSAGVAGVAHASDHLAALDLLPLGKTRRVGREMGVIIHPLLVGRALVNGDPAAALAEEQLLDRP